MIRTALTIAGSDSSAGAGVQCDLKTFSAFGIYGFTALTAVTAQNSKKISSAYMLPESLVVDQIESIFQDYEVNVIKLGMLGNEAILSAVFDRLSGLPHVPIVMDPVMVSKTGRLLLAESAVTRLCEQYARQVTLVTPNIPEAEYLTGIKIEAYEDLKKAAVKLHQMGFQQVLIKGGHMPSEDCLDMLFDGQIFWEWTSKRQHVRNTHGTGCTYASAIASGLALGNCMVEAVEKAKRYMDRVISQSLDIGEDAGPLGHFSYKQF